MVKNVNTVKKYHCENDLDLLGVDPQRSADNGAANGHCVPGCATIMLVALQTFRLLLSVTLMSALCLLGGTLPLEFSAY